MKELKIEREPVTYLLDEPAQRKLEEDSKNNRVHTGYISRVTHEPTGETYIFGRRRQFFGDEDYLGRGKLWSKRFKEQPKSSFYKKEILDLAYSQKELNQLTYKWTQLELMKEGFVLNGGKCCNLQSGRPKDTEKDKYYRRAVILDGVKISQKYFYENWSLQKIVEHFYFGDDGYNKYVESYLKTLTSDTIRKN